MAGERPTKYKRERDEEEHHSGYDHNEEMQDDNHDSSECAVFVVCGLYSSSDHTLM